MDQLIAGALELAIILIAGPHLVRLGASAFLRVRQAAFLLGCVCGWMAHKTRERKRATKAPPP